MILPSLFRTDKYLTVKSASQRPQSKTLRRGANFIANVLRTYNSQHEYKRDNHSVTIHQNKSEKKVNPLTEKPSATQISVPLLLIKLAYIIKNSNIADSDKKDALEYLQKLYVSGNAQGFLISFLPLSLSTNPGVMNHIRSLLESMDTGYTPATHFTTSSGKQYELALAKKVMAASSPEMQSNLDEIQNYIIFDYLNMEWPQDDAILKILAAQLKSHDSNSTIKIAIPEIVRFMKKPTKKGFLCLLEIKGELRAPLLMQLAINYEKAKNYARMYLDSAYFGDITNDAMQSMRKEDSIIYINKIYHALDKSDPGINIKLANLLAASFLSLTDNYALLHHLKKLNGWHVHPNISNNDKYITRVKEEVYDKYMKETEEYAWNTLVDRSMALQE